MEKKRKNNERNHYFSEIQTEGSITPRRELLSDIFSPPNFVKWVHNLLNL